MILLLLPLFALLFVLAAGWHHELRAHHRTQRAHSRTHAALVASEEYRDAVKRSALKGAPLVRWHRDLAAGLPSGADMWYWRIRTADGDLLLTDEQLKVAQKRAAGLLSQPETAAQKAATNANATPATASAD